MATGTWPLVGRGQELERIDHLLAAGAPGGVVLSGPAGVGKTRLAGEALELAARRGSVTARVLATRAAAGLPFGAFAPLLPAVAEPGQEPSHVLGWALREVSRLGEGGPLAVMVDDAHLLDDSSAALTLQLAATRSAFLIVTVRSPERAPDAIAALSKDELAEWIDVRALDPAAVDALVAAVLDGPVEGRTLQRLAAVSAGNPLYLRELVLAALSSGTLAQDRGLWRLTGAPPMSARLTEVVTARLGTLGEAERQALEVVASGEPIDLVSLEACCPAAAPGTFEALERRGLLTVGYSRRRLEARLAHPLYAEVLRAGMPALSARSITTALADALETTGLRRREDLLRFATWRVAAGGAVQADLMLRAAKTAADRWDLPLADRLAEAAAGAGGGFDAGLLLARLSWMQGHFEDADARLSGLAAQATDDSQRARLAETRISILLWGSGRTADALRVAEDAEAVIRDLPARDQVTAERARLLSESGLVTQALEAVMPLVARATGRTLVAACHTAAWTLNRVGRFAESLELSDRGYAAHLAHTGAPMAFGAYSHRMYRAAALLYAGHVDESERLTATEYRRALEQGSVRPQAAFSVMGAAISLARGRVATAGRQAAEAAAIYREQRWLALLRLALSRLAQAQALGGSLAEARASLAELDDLGPPPGLLSRNGCLELEVRAWAAAVGGDVASARTLAGEVVTATRMSGDRVAEAEALHDLARWGLAPDVAGRLAELATIIEGDLAPALADHAAALASRDARGLGAASAAFEGMGFVLFSAEAAAAEAVEQRRAGNPRAAAGAERRCNRLLRECEGAMTPKLRHVRAQALVTARELEVAALAAAGLSNREIAARLFSSLRTVENQLQRVYEKLGVRRRGELALALGGDEPAAIEQGPGPSPRD